MSDTSEISTEFSANRLENLLTALRQSGMRMTPQRYGICQALAESREHPTAQLIFEQMQAIYPSISLATVYNTLNTMLDAGFVQGLDAAGDGALHFDANPEPHIHLVCVRCHNIKDFMELQISGVTDQIQQISGYQLREVRMVCNGLCPRCKKDIEKNERLAEMDCLDGK